MSDKQAFISELALQESDGSDPTSHTIGTALGWDFSRTSRTLEGLESSGLVKTTVAARRSGDTHLDDWVNLTAEGKALVQALEQDGNDRIAAADPAERWSRIDLPVLLELARAAESDEGVARIDDIARRHGLRSRDVLTSFDTLKRTGFVDARLDPDSGGEYSFIRLSEKGLQTTGLWPTPETALYRMIAALDTIAENSNDEDTRTKAQKFAAWLRASGTTVGLSVASTVLTGQIPGTQ
jgi:DNA-binding MarR family transcriptional regulator